MARRRARGVGGSAAWVTDDTVGVGRPSSGGDMTIRRSGLWIAFSILLLVAKIVRLQRGESSLPRNDRIVAFCFRLLQAFGIASALSDIGLPCGDIPLALFAFNVAGVLVLRPLGRLACARPLRQVRREGGWTMQARRERQSASREKTIKEFKVCWIITYVSRLRVLCVHLVQEG